MREQVAGSKLQPLHTIVTCNLLPATCLPYIINRMQRTFLCFICVLGIAFSLCASNANEILVNQQFVDKLGIRPGDSVFIAAQPSAAKWRRFRVRGIYSEKADPSQVPLRRSMVKMHLPDLQMLTGRNDELDLVSISLRHGSSQAAALASRLNSEAIGFTAYSAPALASRSSRTFE